MGDNDKKPLLDLDTLFTRPKVKIDGEVYELLHPDEVSIIATQALAYRGRRIEALMTKDVPALPPDEQAELQRVLDESVQIILIAPPEVQAKLGDGQRFKIIQVFGDLSREDRRTAGDEKDPASTPNLPATGAH